MRLVAQLTAIVSISAGMVHVSAAQDHEHLPVMTAGFLAVAVLQLTLGSVLLRRRPSRVVVAGAVAMMLGCVGLWLMSRTKGIPVEPIGFKDGVCKLFHVVAIPGLLLLWSGELAGVKAPSPKLALQSLGVVGAGAVALMVPGLTLETRHVHSHEMAMTTGAMHHRHAAMSHGHAAPMPMPMVGSHAHPMNPTAMAQHEHAAMGVMTPLSHAQQHAGGMTGHRHMSGGGSPMHHHGGGGGMGGGMTHDHAGHSEAGHAAMEGHDHGAGGGSSDDDGRISLTYEPASPGRGSAITFKSPNGPYEYGAHAGEHGHDPNCHPSPAQQAAADKLYADTIAGLKKYENNPAQALADGFYQVVGPADRFVHMINMQRVFDSTILDPSQIESFMYAMTDRGLVPIGGMYIMPAEFKDMKVVPKEPKHGPEIGGCLTHWHKHGGWVAGFTTGGTNWEETPEMLHVWTYPGLDPWGSYGGRELSQLWKPWANVPSVCRVSVPDGTNVCFP